MRILSIDYSDGRQTLGAGVKLTLVQDVFANVFDYGALQGPNPEFVIPPSPIPDLDSTLIIESGFIDLVNKPTDSEYRALQNAGRRDPREAAWWSIGVGDPYPIVSDPVTVTAVEENLMVNTAVAGTLVDAIPENDNDDPPFNQRSLVIYVAGYPAYAPLPAFGDVIRVDQELFVVQRSYSSPYVSYIIIDLNQRGYFDTTPVSHAIGTQVVFWKRMAQFATRWDGTPYTIYAVSNSGVRQRYTETPTNPVARAVRPPCPSNIAINLLNTQTTSVIGRVDVSWTVRSREGETGLADLNLRTYVELWYGGERKTFQRVLYGNSQVTFGNYGSVFFSGAEIELATGVTAGRLEFHLYSMAASDTVRSWQTAVYKVDWRRSGTCSGWDCDWGNNWGGDTAGGFGIDFGEDYGQGP